VNIRQKHQSKYRYRQRTHRRRFWLLIPLVAYSLGSILWPWHTISPEQAKNQLSITTPVANLPWPAYGQAAFGTANPDRVLASNGPQIPLATASTTKVLTALVILNKKPLKPGADGPAIPITDADVAIYHNYVAQDGSVTPVIAGASLTQREMLEALLLPSANNVADTLAIWAYGSLAGYKSAAQEYLKQHGLTQTTVGSDASGLAPDSVSTARDLVKLGGLAMKEPVVREIVGKSQATISGVGQVNNVNSLLGKNGIIGIKTGNNDQNPGAFMGATTVTQNGKTATLLTAIMGAPSLAQALADSNNLLAAARTTVADTVIVRKGDVLGNYNLPAGGRVQAIAAADLHTTLLRGDTVTVNLELEPITYTTKSSQKVGTASLPKTSLGSEAAIAIVLKDAPAQPSIFWRLAHPLGQ